MIKRLQKQRWAVTTVLCLILAMLGTRPVHAESYTLSVGESVTISQTAYYGYIDNVGLANYLDPHLGFSKNYDGSATITVNSYFDYTATVSLVFVERYTYLGHTRAETYYRDINIKCKYTAPDPSKMPTKVTVPKKIRVELGKQTYVNASIEPYGATVTSIRWYKFDGGAYYNLGGSGSVNDLRGTVTGKILGTGTAYVEINNDENLRAYFDIEVVDPENLPPTGILLPSTYEISVGGHATIEPILSPSNSSTSYTWTSDNTSVATVIGGKVTGVTVGTATVKVKTANNLTASCVINVVSANGKDDEDDEEVATMGIIDGKEYVDLGFSVNWATYDLGAYKQGEKGFKFAWGETETKESFSWSNYKYGNNYKNITNIGSNIKGTQYDAAYVNWGSKWGMPTEMEVREMLSKCVFSVDSVNGIEGYRATGPNGNSIFFPVIGDHWTSSLDSRSNFPELATCMRIYRHPRTYDWVTSYASEERVKGLYVRAVCSTDGAQAGVQPATISLEEYSMKVQMKEKIPMIFTVSPSNATTTLRWKSSNPSVAQVSGSGLVTAVADGTTTISVTTGNGKVAQCVIMVGNGASEQLKLTVSPSGGEITAGTKVYLSTTNATGADIYYTLNGSTPSKSSTKYTTAGITISESCTLKAIAYKDGYEASEVLTAGYTVKQSPAEDVYYYVGSLNGWNIRDRSYPFVKSEDGITWTLTMTAATSDEFLIVPAKTTDWSGLTYGTVDSNLREGSITENEGDNNFRVPYWAGMDAFKIDVNFLEKTYSITRHRSTITTTCAGVQAGTDGKSYRVEGVVGNISNTTYGNWYLSDATGEIFIYGTRDKNGHTGQNNSIDVWNIETGDSIIVVGIKKVYNGIVELLDVGVEKITKKNPFIIENGIIQVTPQDSLQLAVYYAPSNTTIKLSAGDYYISYPTLDYYGGLSIQKDLTIEGEGIGITTIHGRFDMLSGAGLTLKNLTLDGENCNQSQSIIYRDNTVFNDLTILNCEVKNYQKGFLYVNVAAEINNITIDNCLIHDMVGLQDFFDCRQGFYANFIMMNSTIYNCCINGRDFFRIDDSSSSFVNPPSPQIIVKQCTFYQVGTSGDTRLFYVRFAGNRISFTDNVVALFSGTRGFTDVSKTDQYPTLRNNFYYKTENLCSPSENSSNNIKWFDTNGTVLSESTQLFQDVDKYDFRILSQQITNAKAGDPRWLTAGIVSPRQINLPRAGYATFFSSESAYTLPNGLSAQIVTSASNNKLTYKTIADGSVSGIVPKGTAVMLVSDDKQAGTYKLEPSESSVTYGGTNLLHGSDEATTTTGYGLYYKLSYGPTGTQWNDVFGWYWGAQNGAPFQIEDHKAWLVVPSRNSTRAAGFSIEGDVLGVESIEEPTDLIPDLYFDLQGRRISQPTKSGVYIKNGKIAVVK